VAIRSEPHEQIVGASTAKASHLRSALLVLEGYAYLLLIIGVFAGAIALLSWGLVARRPLVSLAALSMGLPLLFTTSAAIRSLFFRIPDPDGIPIGPDQAPALYALIEELRREVQAPAVDRILVGGLFNASAIQLPRAGLFWRRNTLLIGYPLLALLTPGQLRAVIAHELGHLSKMHGRFSVWMYRTRVSWMRLFDTLHARRTTPIFAFWLFRWYAPRLHKHSAGMSRRQELLADRCAADVAGVQTTADTLVAMEIGAALLNRFWRVLLDGEDPEAPRPYASIRPELWSTFANEASVLLEEQLADGTDPCDTHPSLRDRLDAIEGEPRLPPLPAQTAGDVYVGGYLESVATALDARWLASHGTKWRAEQDALSRSRQRLRELAALQAPTPDEMFERGELADQLEGIDCALPHYRAAFDRGHAHAALALGRILLDREEEGGIAVLERAMHADTSLVQECCERLAVFCRSRNRIGEAHRYRLRSTREATRAQLADAERNHVRAIDRFAAPDVTALERSRMVDCLACESAVMQAFLVAKELRHSTGTKLVLAIVARGADASDLPERIRQKALLPADAAIVLLGRHDQPLRAALEEVRGSRIYDRRSPAAECLPRPADSSL
jgi:Zn-dependent protease with chaperone function